MTTTPRLISCDEAGYTGPNLTNDSQPLFAYAAHDLDRAESSHLVAAVRATRGKRIQALELKAAGLRARTDWPEIAHMVVEAMKDRFLFIVMDKRLALAAKAYEYLVEPVVQDNSLLFYRHGLHRFVAAAVHRTIAARGHAVEAVAKELEDFMRSFEPADAPSLFVTGVGLPSEASVMSLLLRFARGYKERISIASEFLRDSKGHGKWTLDLTSTSLHCLLADGFGKRHACVDVLCDESKPLLAMKSFLDTWVGRDEEIAFMGPTGETVTWRLNLARPIEFGRSIDNPSLQLADVLAGAASEIYGPADRNRLAPLKDLMDGHIHSNHILPDEANPFENDDFTARVNRSVLVTLVGRAETHQDPIAGMSAVYAKAMERFSKPAARAAARDRRGKGKISAAR
jgi:hypothetical protein